MSSSAELDSDRLPLLTNNVANNSVQDQVGESGDAQERPTATPVPLNASPLFKLLSCFNILFSFSIAFTASINEAQVAMEEHSDQSGNSSHHESYSLTEQAGLLIECAQLLIGISTFLYLMLRIVQTGTIRRAVLINKYQQPAKETDVGELTWCRKMPHHLANYPTSFFMIIFTVFSILGLHCVLFQYLEQLTEHHTKGFMLFIYTCKSILLTVFVIIQLCFFVMHSQVCLSWKLNQTWLAFSAIVSTNLSCWCFHTRLEISHVIIDDHSNFCTDSDEHSASSKEISKSLAEGFGPFLSETFLMGAILSISVLSNAGRWGKALLRKLLSGVSVAEAKRSTSANYQVKGKLMKKFRRDKLKLGYLYLLLICAVIGALIFKLNIPCSIDFENRNASLNRIKITCYITGCVILCVLLCFATVKRLRDERHRVFSEAPVRHTADRVMLWCGLAGVVLYRLYRLWRVFFRSSEQSRLPYLDGGASLCIILQSVLQVAVIDRILADRIKHLRQWFANTVAWLLILLNAIEWFIYSTAFSFILSYRNRNDPVSMALAIVTVPLNVFFSFHSIGCFYDFKHYMHQPRHHRAESQGPPDNDQQAANQEMRVA